MRTPAARLLSTAAIAVLALAGCGSDEDSSEPSIGEPATVVATTTTATAAADTTTAATEAVASSTATTVPLTEDTSDIPVMTVTDGTNDIVVITPPDTADAPIVISVTVGIDDAVDRVENVPLGSVLTLMVTNPDSDDEFHLHGYDLGDGVEMPAGQTETFTFTADQAGDFELESHETGQVLVTLRVA
jgi:hypothetical protein